MGRGTGWVRRWTGGSDVVGPRTARRHFRLLAASALALALGGCGSGRSRPAPQADGGTAADRGKALIAQFGCGACHVIPGVDGADGRIAPPLTDWARRRYVAGLLPNTPEALALWIEDPQAVKPGTAMPTMAIGPVAARDIAAYLSGIGASGLSERAR